MSIVEHLRERSEAITTMLLEPQWKPSRSHVETLRNYMVEGVAEIERLQAENRQLHEAAAEIERLQEAKRRALAVANERSKDNVALRAALKQIAELDVHHKSESGWTDVGAIARRALEQRPALPKTRLDLVNEAAKAPRSDEPSEVTIRRERDEWPDHGQGRGDSDK